jgi:hypothetical protein
MKVGSEVISLEPHRFYNNSQSIDGNTTTPIGEVQQFAHPLKEYYVDSFSNHTWPEQAKNFTCIIIIYI